MGVEHGYQVTSHGRHTFHISFSYMNGYHRLGFTLGEPKRQT